MFLIRGVGWREWLDLEVSSQSGLSWYGGYSNTNNHSLHPWWAEKLFRTHVKPWRGWATAAEDHTGFLSIQPITGIWSYSGHRLWDHISFCLMWTLAESLYLYMHDLMHYNAPTWVADNWMNDQGCRCSY